MNKNILQQRVQAQDLVQNFLLLWLDANLDESNEDFCNSIIQLRRTVDTIETFRDIDDCLQYISQFTNEKAFLVVSGALSDIVVPRMHDTPQIYAIYIFCREQSKYEKWATKDLPKVRGIFTEIGSVCTSVRQAARECDDDAVVIVSEIEPSFMYTTLFKEIVLEIDFDEQTTIRDLADYTRMLEVYRNNKKQLDKIDEFVRDYHGNVDNTPIRWYTAECFTYNMVNKALGNLDIPTLLKTGFFIRDLHQNLQQVHDKQIVDKDRPFPAKVYRGQAMTEQDFKGKINQDKLLSYNNFLSTTEDRETAVRFIRNKLQSDKSKLGVLFTMNIDASMKLVPYARIAEFSHFPAEKEILFSTHTIFRVKEIKKINERGIDIWYVTLTLASDTNDKQFSELLHSIRDEITGSGWNRMGSLLWSMGHNDKAEEIYILLLKEANTDLDKAYCYHQLGLVKSGQGEYNAALDYCHKSIMIDQSILPENHPSLATSYNNISQLYNNMGDYTKALEYHEKSLQIRKIALPENHSDLASSYNNIGQVYNDMGDYTEALEYHEKSLQIRKIALPENHPDLATSYSNIGQLYNNMGDYTKALEYYEKSLQITKIALPENHPSLATSYSNIAIVYDHMGDYTEALEYHEKSLQIRKIALPENHSDLASSYNNIGQLYNNMGDYTTALEYYEKSLQIYKIALPENHPSLATSYNNIGQVYNDMGDYTEALEYHEKSFQITKIALPENHPLLATSYSNIAIVYNRMGDYTKALEYHEKSLQIRKIALPENHPSLATSYNNIGQLYNNMGDYTKALEYYEKSLQITKIALPENHPYRTTH